MTIGDTTLECIPNDFVMIPPNVVHSFYLNDENECSFYHIHFFPEFLSHITLEEDSTVNLMHSMIFCCSPFLKQKVTKDVKERIYQLSICILQARNLWRPHISISIYYNWFCLFFNHIKLCLNRNFLKK